MTTTRPPKKNIYDVKIVAQNSKQEKKIRKQNSTYINKVKLASCEKNMFFFVCSLAWKVFVE